MMDLNTLKLNCYGKYVLSANIEEKPEDIALAVLYTDHGDDFLVVRCKDGTQHEYGFYMNRRWAPDNPEELGSNYIRKPVLYAKKDVWSSTSNDAFFAIRDFYKEDGRSWMTKKYSNPEYAQRNFECLLEKLEGCFATGRFYCLENERKEVLECLQLNGINTPENIILLRNAKFSSRHETGVDGIAARKISDEDVLLVDSIEGVFHDGKWLTDPSDYIIDEDDDCDEWGVTYKYFHMNQFDVNEIDNIIAEIECDISEIYEYINRIKEALDSADLSQLYRIRGDVADANNRISYCDWHCEEDQNDD